MRPYVVRRITGPDGVVHYTGHPQSEGQAVSQRTAAAVTELLVRVTEVGTGKQARVDGFTVAGKTGTAQKVDLHTGHYSARDRMSSFVGFVPAEDPAMVILVVIDSPRKATYGGVVAAPVFRAVAEYGLARRGVLPHTDRMVSAVSPPPALQPISARLPDIAAPGALPSFVGLSMREALVRAHAEGWAVRVQGSGYVASQDPPAGAMPPDRVVTLHFGANVS